MSSSSSSSAPRALTVVELSRRVQSLLTDPLVMGVWVVGELLDVRTSRGHCYFELIQKDAAGVNTVGRIRCTIWASVFAGLRSKFAAATGADFTSGIKVMVRGTVSYSELYGLSFNVVDVDPSFTLGDRMKRRREIVERLRREGICDLNRELPLPSPLQRIAIISAPGAAGYGDFVNQLFNNPRSLRFSARLYPALVQGAQAPKSIISALDAVAADADEWDCVVIIRGGGSTTDLEAFDDYDLAANVAQFPLPVLIGIGHERDICVLDWVANTRLKTPTAVAEYLIHRGAELLDDIISRASIIQQTVSRALAEEQRRLAYIQGVLPVAPLKAVDRARVHISSALLALSQVSARRIAPALGRLDSIASQLPAIAATQTSRARERLGSIEKLVKALSPEATLARGYSITLVDGHAVTDASTVASGTKITSRLAKGEITSITTE